MLATRTSGAPWRGSTQARVHWRGCAFRKRRVARHELRRVAQRATREGACSLAGELCGESFVTASSQRGRDSRVPSPASQQLSLRVPLAVWGSPHRGSPPPAARPPLPHDTRSTQPAMVHSLRWAETGKSRTGRRRGEHTGRQRGDVANRAKGDDATWRAPGRGVERHRAASSKQP